MKIEELKKAIRNLVRQEVKKIVAEEVSKAMGKVLVEMVKEIKSNNPSPIVEEVENVPDSAAILQTKNPKLNSVLAETARHFRPLPKTTHLSDNLVELMGGEFEKIGKEENPTMEPPTTKLDFLKQMVGPSAVESQPSALDGGAEVPDALKKVFKKDFRAVMKKIDEQKKGLSGGGYIDTSKLLTG